MKAFLATCTAALTMCCATVPPAAPMVVPVETPAIPAAHWTVEFKDPTASQSEWIACQRGPNAELLCYDLRTLMRHVALQRLEDMVAKQQGVEL